MRRVGKGDLNVKLTVKAQDDASLLAQQFNQMVEGLRERDKLRDTVGRYMTQQVSDAILRGDVKLGGEEREVTILYAHWPLFEDVSLSAPGQSLAHLVNSHLGGLAPIVSNYRGIVDKFIGGDLLAIFGAPSNDLSHAEHAVRAALEMRAANQEVAIGVESGIAVTGNFGSEIRMEYMALGQPVILAEGLAKRAASSGNRILIGNDTANAIQTCSA